MAATPEEKLAKALNRLTDAVAVQTTALVRVEAEQAIIRARLDTLLLRVAAFKDGGAVLILQKPLEESLLPAGKGGT